MLVFRISPVLQVTTLLILVFSIWLIGFIMFSAGLPTLIDDKTTRTHAIVVLTGGSERIATGISLLDQGMAEQLFISGVGTTVSIDDLIDTTTALRKTIISRMTLGSEAEDTPGNALETAKWACTENIASIRLVTAAYHMPRSLRDLKQAMPNMVIIPHPVLPDQVKTDWWKHPGTANLLASEYNKYLFSGIQLWLLSLLDIFHSKNSSQPQC